MPIPDTILPPDKAHDRDDCDILRNNPLLRALADLLDTEEAFARKECSAEQLQAAQRKVDVLFFEFHERLKAGDKSRDWKLRSN